MNWQHNNWGAMIYLWHSINIFPAISIFNIASNDQVDPVTGCKGWDGKIVARSLELTLFGVIINLMWPNQKFKRQYSSSLIGPLYSRKRKVWYKS